MKYREEKVLTLTEDEAQVIRNLFWRLNDKELIWQFMCNIWCHNETFIIDEDNLEYGRIEYIKEEKGEEK